MIDKIRNQHKINSLDFKSAISAGELIND